MNKKICVYTCITGNYDLVNEIRNKEEKIDYYLFTNNKNITSETWKVIYIEDETLDNQRLSRKIKMLGHPIINDKYDIFVWMDASVIWEKSITEFVEKYLKNNSFVTFKHSLRNCIYDEAYECIKLRKDKKEDIIRHINFLRKENYPEQNGLCEMTVFIKRKDSKVEETMKIWFDTVCNYSKRDQLSFMYAVWKTGLKLSIIKKNVWDNEWFKHSKHTYKMEITDCRIFYGDSSLENEKYSPDLDEIYSYIKKDYAYLVKTKIPRTTKVIEIELTDIPCIKYSDFIINLPCKKVTFYNTIPYKNDNVFYSDRGIVRLEGDFKKGKKLEFNITLKKLSNIEQYELINNLSVNLIISTEDQKNQKQSIKELNEELSYIKKSLFYKIFFFKKNKKQKNSRN